MTTVREICTDALIELGVLDPSEQMDGSSAAFALRTLNRLLQVWNTEDLMVYTVNRTTYNLVAGQQTYTLGTGGDFNMSRPARIDMVSIIVNTGSYPLEIPLQIVTDDEWRAVSLKAVPSTFPTKVWITGNMPLNSLYFWPVPQDSTVEAVLYSWGKMDGFTSINDTVSLPNGYEEALVTNLAMFLCSSYGIQPNPTLGLRAAMSKSAIQSLNVSPLWATTDDGLMGGRGNSLAIQTQGLQVDR